MNLFASFRRAADEYAANVSVQTKTKTLTYAEVHQGVVRAGRVLIERGLEPGKVAALLLPNGPQFVQVFFGVQAAGGISLLLNCLLRPEELVFQLRHSGARLLVTSAQLASALGCLQAELPELRILDANEVLAAPGGGLERFPGESADPDQPGVLLYTSGTTADPKGVLLSHRNLISDFVAFQQRFAFEAGDRFVSPLPFFHSFGLTTVLLATQLTGAGMEALAGFQPQECVEAVGRSVGQGLRTVFLGVPPMFNLMTRVPGRWRLDRMYAAISGGAALPMPVFERFRDRFGYEVFQGYGLTEAAPVVACNSHGAHRPGTVGRPFAGIEAQVWGPEDEALASGQEGELVVRGPNVMLGYLRNPEATRAAKTPDGWLRTGDVARIETDGFVTICGRSKELIISAGENIHPQEIETVLGEHPKVAEAAVVGVPDPLKGEVPKAFVVPLPGVQLDKAELRAHCLERLAEIKVPRHFVFLESLPKTGLGKVIKRRLLASEQSSNGKP